MGLRCNGARVDIITTAEGGHGLIDDQSLPLFYEWLNKVISN